MDQAGYANGGLDNKNCSLENEIPTQRMEILNDMVWIPAFFFASDLIKDAILGDERAMLKMFPADQAALEHSKAYYRSPISLLEHLMMWGPFFLGLEMWTLWRQRFGEADSIFDPIGFLLFLLFGGLGVFMSLKIKTWAIRIFMRRFNLDTSNANKSWRANRP